MAKYHNAFDDLDAQSLPQDEYEKIVKQQDEKRNHLDKLIHRVFKQSAEGQELLKVWKDAADAKPGAEPGMDLLEIGITEGYKRFIRHIERTIKKVEE